MSSKSKSLWFRTLLFSCLLLWFLNNFALSQNLNPGTLATGGIPRKLVPGLMQRLSQFIEYNRTQQWDHLSGLLADFTLLGVGRKKVAYTQAEMRELITGIKEKPVVNFIPVETSTSTENRFLPLTKRLWMIWGCADFKEREQLLKTEALILAFYQNRNWVFSPIKLFCNAEDGSTVPCKTERTNSGMRLLPPKERL